MNYPIFSQASLEQLYTANRAGKTGTLHKPRSGPSAVTCAQIGFMAAGAVVIALAAVLCVPLAVAGAIGAVVGCVSGISAYLSE